MVIIWISLSWHHSWHLIFFVVNYRPSLLIRLHGCRSPLPKSQAPTHQYLPFSCRAPLSDLMRIALPKPTPRGFGSRQGATSPSPYPQSLPPAFLPQPLHSMVFGGTSFTELRKPNVPSKQDRLLSCLRRLWPKLGLDVDFLQKRNPR